MCATEEQSSWIIRNYRGYLEGKAHDSEVFYRVDSPIVFEGRKKKKTRPEIWVPNDITFDPQIHGKDGNWKVQLRVKLSELKLLLALEFFYLMENKKAVAILVFLKPKEPENVEFVC